jgi:anti-anti-sigma factor
MTSGDETGDRPRKTTHFFGPFPSPWTGRACSLRDGTLKVTGALDRIEWAAFEDACRELVEREEWRAVKIDLSGCKYLSSLFIGLLVGTYMKIEKQGRAIEVKVSPEVARFLDMAHLGEVMKYEVVGSEGRGAGGSEARGGGD